MTEINRLTVEKSVNYKQLAGKFYRTLPLYAAVPICFWIAFVYAGFPIKWTAFGIGAAGWWLALMLRGPLALLAKKMPQQRAMAMVVAASGPLEEGVRLLALGLTGMSFHWALSLGQGWAAIEVLFTIVNGIVQAVMVNRTSEKAEQLKAMLEQSGTLGASPLWGVCERIFASAFHIGAALVIARLPWLAVVMTIVHTGFNLISLKLSKQSILFTELFVALVGTIVLVLGFILFN